MRAKTASCRSSSAANPATRSWSMPTRNGRCAPSASAASCHARATCRSRGERLAAGFGLREVEEVDRARPAGLDTAGHDADVPTRRLLAERADGAVLLAAERGERVELVVAHRVQVRDL